MGMSGRRRRAALATEEEKRVLSMICRVNHRLVREAGGRTKYIERVCQGMRKVCPVPGWNQHRIRLWCNNNRRRVLEERSEYELDAEETALWLQAQELAVGAPIGKLMRMGESRVSMQKGVWVGKEQGFGRMRSSAESGLESAIPPWKGGVDLEAQKEPEWWGEEGLSVREEREAESLGGVFWGEGEGEWDVEGVFAYFRGSSEELAGTEESAVGWSERFGSAFGHPGDGLAVGPPRGSAG